MECPRCFTTNAAQARFCSQCGYALVKSPICRHCFSLIAPHDHYCSHCGNRALENLNTGGAGSLPTVEIEQLARQVEFRSFDALVETRETLPISPALTMETSPVRITSEQSTLPNETAIQPLTMLLQLLDDTSENWQWRFDIQNRRQRIYRQRGLEHEREADLQQMLVMAQLHADQRRLSDVYNEMADLYLRTGRYREAHEVATQALEIKKTLDDGNPLSQKGVGYSLQRLGVIHLAQHEYLQAADYFEQAYEIFSKLEVKREKIETSSYLSQAYLGLEALEKARSLSEQALALFADHPEILTEAYELLFHHFRILEAQGDPEAIPYLQKTYDLMRQQAIRINDPAHRQSFLQNVNLNRAIQTAVEAHHLTPINPL